MKSRKSLVSVVAARVLSSWMVSVPVALPALAAAVAVGGCSHAREEATTEMERLQKVALAEMRKGHPQEAKKSLLEAIRVGRAGGVDRDPVMARTHLALGSLYAGLGQIDRAKAHMAAAIDRDPEVKLTKTLNSPAARKALAAAKAGDLKEEKSEIAEKPEKPEKASEKVAKADEKPAAETKPAAAPAPEKPAPIEPPPAPVAAAPKAPAPAAVDVEEGTERGAGLACRAPEEVPPDNEVFFRCAVRSDLKPGKVVLHYRAAGSETFTDVVMGKNKRGLYTGAVPASATAGKSLQYYVDTRGGAKVENGTSESPNLILVRDGAPPAGRNDPVPGKPGSGDDGNASRTSSEDEDPLAAVAHAREVEREREGVHRREAGHFWVGLGLGSAYGWQKGGSLEFRDDRQVAAGPLSGGLVHLLPELGYQLTDDFTVSLQLRFQYIPTDGSGDATAGSPKTTATAVLVRATYALGPSNLRPYISAVIGGGDGFRLKVPANAQQELVRSDTVRGGPLLAGGSLGLVYHVNPHFAWTGEARLLEGLPSATTLLEIDAGLQVGF